MISRCIAAALLTFSCGYAFGQASLDVPSLGWVLDTTRHQLRPVWGLPGSASLGEPLDLGSTFGAVVVAPSQKRGVALTEDGEFRILHLEKDPAADPLDGVLSGGTLLTASPAVTAAAVWHKEASRISVISGLASGELAVRSVDLSALGCEPSALAVRDDSGLIVAACRAGEGVNLWGVAPDLSPALIASVPEATAIVFRGPASDLLIAAESSNTIALVRDAGNANEYRILAGEAEGINQPRALRVTGEGYDKLWIASARQRTVSYFDMASGTLVSTLACSCEPVRLEPLAGSLLRLTDVAGPPVWVFDSDEAQLLRMFFVPPPVLSVSSEEEPW